MTAETMPPSAKNPDEDEFDEAFVNALAAVDEQLKIGRFPSNVDGADASTVESNSPGATACLQFLSRTLARRDQSAVGALPENLGRFELLRELGQGGFGVVYLARDPRLGRLVAIKVPRLHTLGNPTLHQRFLREARAVAALDHPHILPILETGEIGPVCYMASAYCDGGDLSHWIKNNAPVAPQLAARIIATLADATHYSHDQGILHRDLKPGNVLLATRNAASDAARDDLQFVLRITDFGLARLAEEDLAATGSTVLGTPTYMSPEQAAGQNDKVTAGTDVYALGVMLYELLTARPPFQGTGYVEVLDQIRTEEPVSLSRLIRSIPRDLETICLKCLHKDPKGRYTSAADLHDDLQRFLRHEPIRAKPTPVVEIVLKWARRHPARVAAIGISMFAVSLLAAGLIYHLYEVQGHLKVSNELRKQGLDRESKLRVQAYVGEIEAASADLLAGLPDRARTRLEQFIPSASVPNDVRGPEWQYLWGQSSTMKPVLSLKSETFRTAFSFAFSPDGKQMVNGDSSGVIRLWDLKSGQQLKSIQAHDGEVRALEFSPDGRHLVSGGCYRRIKVWNVADWSLASECDAHAGTVMSIDFSPDGERLISGGRDGEIRYWDWRQGKELWHTKLGQVVYNVKFADRGQSVYSTHDNAVLIKWEVATWKNSNAETIGDQTSKLLTMTISPNSRLLVGGGYGEEIYCYDTVDHQQYALPVGNSIYAADFSPDGQQAAVATGGGFVYLLKFVTGSFRVVEIRRWIACNYSIVAMRFSHDGKYLVTSSDDGFSRIWNMNEVPAAEATFLSQTLGSGAKGGGGPLVFGSERAAVAGGTENDSWLRVWDPITLREQQAIEIPNFPLVGDLALDQHSQLLSMKGNGVAVAIWDDPIRNVTPRLVHIPGVRASALSPDGKTLAVGISKENNLTFSVDLYDPATGQFRRHLCPLSPGRIATLQYTGDGTRLLAGFSGAPVHIIDANSGEFVVVPDSEGHQMSISTDDKTLAVGRWGFPAEQSFFTRRSANQVYLIDIASARIKSIIRHSEVGAHTNSVGLSPDGRLLAISAASMLKNYGQVQLWHIETGRKLMSFDSYQFVPSRISFVPGSKYLAVLTHQPGRPANPGVLLWRWDLPPKQLRAQ